ncbi:hypothetical protein SAMN05428642_103227 [Flaviramulus basaltis]|uniref:Sortilin, neurotensin receptor 3 n=1 Tax=Flaviramulus basaltis TaxID=369401 RepID=A0A1K2IMX5_9FLAO|nr:hypothetical protein [Flaviramulus basaltis]SFZ93602.1 hypothetical protein SAMN05428642_103227 [Flaviramulus basaltis]
MKKKVILFSIFLACGTLIHCTSFGKKEKLGNSGNSIAISDSIHKPKIKLLPVVFKEEYDEGLIPGDNSQFILDFTYSESDPDRIYAAQDVSCVWVSNNGGRNWNTLKNKGLYAPAMISIEADPLDKNRVLAVAQSRFYDTIHLDYQGIYLSKDGGLNWEKVAPRTKLGEIRGSTKLITYAPSSKSEALGYAKRWYAAFSEYRKEANGSTNTADDGLLTSNDGGNTWQEIRKLPSSLFGNKIYGIKVDPLNENKLFLYGEEGLFILNNAPDSNDEITKISGTNGLPKGSVYGKVYISKDSNTLIVPVANTGMYKSINNGKSWNLLYAWTDVLLAFYNEGFPDVIYTTGSNTTEGQVRVSKDGGTTWHTNINSKQRPGYNDGNWNQGINSIFARIIPDPRNPDRAFAQGHAKFHQTDDGGLNWVDSSSGFNGSQYTGMNMQQMFDPNNPDHFVYFMIDRGVHVTENRGRYFNDNTIKKVDFEGIHKTVYGAAMCPSIDSSKVLLASVNKTPSGKLLRSNDNGKTWKEVVSSGLKSRFFVAFHHQNPQYAYQWRERSDDYGITWKELKSMPKNTMICGMSPSNGDIIYAVDNLKGGVAKKIWISLDKGDTWKEKPVISVDWDLTVPGPDRHLIFNVHPTNPNIVYTSNEKGGVTQWDLSSNKTIQTDIDVLNGETEENFYINRFVIDPKFPDIMYAMNQRINTGNKFFMSENGGKSWINISSGFPNTYYNALAVSPITGEVFFSGPNGCRVMLPPYETTNTAYELIPYKNTHIDDTY